MKKLKLRLPLVFLLLLFFALPVSATSRDSLGRLGPIKMNETCDDFRSEEYISKSVKLAVHGRLEITLCSNSSTGYSWSDSAMISNHTVLWQTSHTRLPAPGSALGAPGKQNWTFQALREGTTRISLKYSRAESGGASKNWTYEVKVTVIDPDSGKENRGEQLVREIFDDIGDSNFSELEQRTSEAFQYLDNSGVSDKKNLLESLKEVSPGSYRLGNFKSTREDDSLVVYYTAAANETLTGETINGGRVRMLSVFVDTDSGWKWVAQASC